jgi:hypothetical protein
VIKPIKVSLEKILSDSYDTKNPKKKELPKSLNDN